MCRSRSFLIGGAKKGHGKLLAEPHRQIHSSFATESTQYLPRLVVPGAAVKGQVLPHAAAAKAASHFAVGPG